MMNEKTLLENQIWKIFSIIENSENIEITKIALETLANKCSENITFMYIIFKNILTLAQKGNLRIIQEIKYLIQSMLEDFNFNLISKLLNSEIYEKQFENLILENENLFTINLYSEFENIHSINCMNFDCFDMLDLNSIENLYSNKSEECASNSTNEEGGLSFNKMEMEILFPDRDELREEVEECLRTNIDGKSKKVIPTKNNKKMINKISIRNYYEMFSRAIDISNPLFNNFKKQKLDADETHLKLAYLIFNPFQSIIKEIVELNSNNNWKVRLCSITILNYLKPYYEKLLFSFYQVKISYRIEDKFIIDDIIANDKLLKIKEIDVSLKQDLLTRLIINSLIDKVVDFNSDDNICIFKELNLKFVNFLLNDEEILFEICNFKLVKLLEKSINNSEDWQTIFAILIFIKNSIVEKEKFKLNIFDLICSLMNMQSEEVLNLTIQILETIIDNRNRNMINSVDHNKLKQIFLIFLKIIKRYDDIEMGVKNYFNCVFNFILYFKSINEYEVLEKLIPIIEEEFIYFSLNKIVSVRLKYFEILNNLLDLIWDSNSNKIVTFFSDKFIEKNVFIAYQGLCIEENKDILNSQKIFIEKVIKHNKYINLFFYNHEKFFKLLLKENFTNLNNFYIPHNEKFEKKEIQMIYTGLFKNELEVIEISENYRRKINYIIPLLSLIMTKKIEFTKILLSSLKIDLNSCVISKHLEIFMRIYFHYLELIEYSTNKIFILNEDFLKKLCDNTSLNDMPLLLKRKEAENFSMVFKVFLDFIIKLSKNNLPQDDPSLTVLFGMYTLIYEKNTIKTTQLLELLKVVFEKIKNPNNQDMFKNVFENFRCISLQITNLENSTNKLKTHIRGYSAICLFIHSAYSNCKIEKNSTIAHPILNCLKSNDKKTKVFTAYLIKFLYSINNLETVNKILFSFFDNCLNFFIMENLINDKISESHMFSMNKFSPIKYFFTEFSKFQKFNDIIRMVNEYFSNIKNLNDSVSVGSVNNTSPDLIQISVEIKVVILIYLITFVKSSTMCIDFLSFYNNINTSVVINYANIHPKIIKYISQILINYDTVFIRDDDKKSNINTTNYLNKILNYIFTDANSNSTDNVKIIFLFKIINELLVNDKFVILLCNYLFDILKFLNSKTSELKLIATKLFSKIMKTIALIKMDKDYENSEILKSSNLIKTLLTFNQPQTGMNLNINLKENLRTYQITGINWLSYLGDFGLGLALCDDMGLGKTIQTLVCIVNASKIYQQQHKKNPVNLIVCPKTLILNWINESNKFFHEEDVKLIRVDNIDTQFQKNDSSRIEIFVISYDKVRDIEIFNETELFYLVLDEAHILKNPRTKTYQSIKKLNSQRRIILTGTPIQNNVMELWALFDFLMPGFLGEEHDFEIKYHKNIHSSIKKLNIEEKLQENIFQTSLLEIKKRVKPFIMRRLKQDVLSELPDKIIQDYICEMTSIQKELYSYWNNEYNFNNNTKNSAGKKLNTNKNNSNNTLKAFDCFRKICNYPGILIKDDNLPNQFKKYPIDTFTNFYSSGKLKSLEELLISLNFDTQHIENNTYINNNKVLIFSQYKIMVEKISEFLNMVFPNINISKLTSDMNEEKRLDSVQRFNLDPNINILILTTSIGGLGLSLTSANIVIMFDHDWNPMRDLQAMDRAHRLGQKKTVEVFRLITADTVEEKLINLQTFKKYIANNVVDKTKIHETNLSLNNFMQSLEEFSQNKNIKVNKKNIKSGKKSIDDIVNGEHFDEEMEIEYLKKLI